MSVFVENSLVYPVDILLLIITEIFNEELDIIVNLWLFPWLKDDPLIERVIVVFLTAFPVAHIIEPFDFSSVQSLLELFPIYSHPVSHGFFLHYLVFVDIVVFVVFAKVDERVLV